MDTQVFFLWNETTPSELFFVPVRLSLRCHRNRRTRNQQVTEKKKNVILLSNFVTQILPF